MGSGGGVGVEHSTTDTEVPSLNPGIVKNLLTKIFLVFTPNFLLLFCDTHLGRRAFLSYLYNLLSQHRSFFPSSPLLFLSVQVVQSKQLFFLHLCSRFYLTLLELSNNKKSLLCGPMGKAKKLT